MLIKLIAFLAAAIPIALFLRSIFAGRVPRRVSAGWTEFKKQVDFAVTIFLVLMGGIMAFAVGKMIWTWWSP